MMKRRIAIALSGIAAIAAVEMYTPPSELMAGSSAETAKRSVPVVVAPLFAVLPVDGFWV